MVIQNQYLLRSKTRFYWVRLDLYRAKPCSWWGALLLTLDLLHAPLGPQNPPPLGPNSPEPARPGFSAVNAGVLGASQRCATQLARTHRSRPPEAGRTRAAGRTPRHHRFGAALGLLRGSSADVMFLIVFGNASRI